MYYNTKVDFNRIPQIGPIVRYSKYITTINIKELIIDALQLARVVCITVFHWITRYIECV